MKEIISIITQLAPKLNEITFEQLLIIVLVYGMFQVIYTLINKERKSI